MAACKRKSKALIGGRNSYKFLNPENKNDPSNVHQNMRKNACQQNIQVFHAPTYTQFPESMCCGKLLVHLLFRCFHHSVQYAMH